MSCEGCKGHDNPKELDEVAAVKHAAAIEQRYRLLCAAVASLVLMFAIMTGCMVYAVYNSQRIANEAVLKALETVSEMEVTSTTVTQDSGEGDGNNVYLDGDYTEYNEGRGDSE